MNQSDNCLECEEKEEGHHETEQPHSLGEGKAQDGVGEQLLLERGVPGISDDEGAENRSNSSSRASNTNSGGAGANELGGRVDVSLGGGGGEQLGGLDRGRADAPHSSEGEARRDRETSDGSHSYRREIENKSLKKCYQAIK